MKLSELIITPASAIIVSLGIGLSIWGGFVLFKPSINYWQLYAIGLFFAFTIPAFISLYRTVNKRTKNK